MLAAGLEVEGGRGILEKKGDYGTGFSGQRNGQRWFFDFVYRYFLFPYFVIKIYPESLKIGEKHPDSAK